MKGQIGVKRLPGVIWGKNGVKQVSWSHFRSKRVPLGSKGHSGSFEVKVGKIWVKEITHSHLESQSN